MRKTVILICFILLFYYLCSIYINNNNLKIPNESIRIRVLANSNTNEDQNIKKIVSKEIMRYLNDELKGITNINEARNKIISLQDPINNKISSILSQYNLKQDFNINYGYNYFPEKEFKNNIYKEGYYESLLISLGTGLGDNFWCLLFPPLCLLEGEESKDIEYTSFIKELFN